MVVKLWQYHGRFTLQTDLFRTRDDTCQNCQREKGDVADNEGGLHFGRRGSFALPQQLMRD
jgi:hypothetical protein